MNSIRSFVAISAVAAVAAAQAAGVSASHYVQDGLVSCFDAIDNVGTGVHDASATQWKDLKSTAYLNPAGKAYWGPTYFNCATNAQQFTGVPIVSSYSVTLDLAVNIDYAARTVVGDNNETVWPSLVDGGSVKFHGTGNAATEMRWFINGSEPRINSGTLSVNTVTGTSDGRDFKIYRDGGLVNQALDVTHHVNNSKPYPMDTSANWSVVPLYYNGGSRGRLNARIHCFRLYNRALTANEVRFNRMLDHLRFWSCDIVGDGSSVDWSAATWVNPEGAAKTVPPVNTNDCAVVKNATANIVAADQVGLYALALEDNAKLNLASDAVVAARFLFVADQRIPAGIYTGSGALGTPVDWLEGEGVVRVADSVSDSFPELMPPEPVDGWYEFGLKTGYKYYSNLSNTAHFVDLAKYAFPPNAKIRLVGGLILNPIPAAHLGFSEVDMSGVGYVVFNKDTAFDDGRPFLISSGATGRYQPATWTDMGNNTWKLTNPGGDTFSGDLIVNGLITTSGDNSHLARATFSGHVTGSGTIEATSFSNQSRWTNPVWGFGGTLKAGSNGTMVWIEPQTITNTIREVWIHSCADQAKFRVDASYCCSAFAFGPRSGQSAAAQEIRIKKLTSHTVYPGGGETVCGASSFVDGNGKRWINGSTVIVWGGNTVHAEKVDASMHVVARRQDQQCGNSWLGSMTTFGTGNFIADELSNGADLFLSTNIVKVVIGKITGASLIDYTFQSGAINRATVDITNSCAATATAKATDLAMLPSRLSGFSGKVYLTDTATKSYEIPVDLAHGTNGLYQTVGCIGSGELVEAPASGTINAVFDTETAPVRGSYSLARFTSGGAKLAGWTVLLNGQAVNEMDVCGVRVVAKKDASGIYLKVCNPGLTILLR